jgi:putative phosphoribosyl transferase
MATRRFRDRTEAGRLLAQRLRDYAGRGDVVVLALPRGGVPVAYEVATELGAPLAVFVVRKLGAIASGGVVVLDESLVRRLGIDRGQLERAIAREAQELERREEAYDGRRGPPQLEDKTVILVDDGLATGSTMRAAAFAVRELNPARVVVAVPVAAAETCEELRDLVDEVVCQATPRPFHAVGVWYEDFSQTSDNEVRELLERADARE